MPYVDLKTIALSHALMEFRKKATIAKVAFRDLSAEMNTQRQGDTIRISYFRTPEVTDAEMTVTEPAIQTAAIRSVEMKLDFWKQSGFDIPNKDAQDTGVTWWAKAGAKYGATIADIYERFIFERILETGSNLAANRYNEPIVGSSSVASNVINARAALNKRDVTMDGRVGFVDPDAAALLLANPDFTRYDSGGQVAADSKMTGEMGTRYGIRFMETNNLPKIAAGGAGNFAVATDAVAGATTLAVDGVTGGVNAGEIVTIDGAREHIVTSGFEGTAGTISIGPALSADVSDGDPIVRRDVPSALILHPESVVVATRPALPPSGGHNDGTMDSLPDPETGFSIGIESRRVHNGIRHFFTILGGAIVARPDGVERVIHS